jgi:bile acid-coenzyme A ligase
MSEETISLGAKLALDAATQPDHAAVSCGDLTLSYAELHRRSNRVARGLTAKGAKAGDLITLALPNGVDFVVASYAIWKLGATPQPVSFRLPQAELEDILALADPPLVIADQGRDAIRSTFNVEQLLAAGDSDEDLPDATAPISKAVTSGGSTGRPKLILAGAPGVTPRVTPAIGRFGIKTDTVALMPGPLYHNGPFSMMMLTISAGAHFVLLPRFDAEATLRAIERHRASWLYVVPTMMSRMWRLPAEVREAADVSTLKTVWHMAAPCPPWLKEAFIHWVAPGEVMELYGGTEAIASTTVSGQEWLAHRGSVGRVQSGEMKIVSEDGRTLPSGEVGEIYMRRSPGTPETYRYLGAAARMNADGWESLGDLGWFDGDGYLYLADRRTDMILVGGSNVYPAEVEAALEEHPAVQSCAVIGLPDEDLGARVHAIVNARGDVTAEELSAHVVSRLVTYKCPRSFEFIDEPIRDEAGKVRRSALREARLPRT